MAFVNLRPHAERESTLLPALSSSGQAYASTAAAFEDRSRRLDKHSSGMGYAEIMKLGGSMHCGSGEIMKLGGRVHHDSSSPGLCQMEGHHEWDELERQSMGVGPKRGPGIQQWEVEQREQGPEEEGEEAEEMGLFRHCSGGWDEPSAPTGPASSATLQAPLQTSQGVPFCSGPLCQGIFAGAVEGHAPACSRCPHAVGPGQPEAQQSVSCPWDAARPAHVCSTGSCCAVSTSSGEPCTVPSVPLSADLGCAGEPRDLMDIGGVPAAAVAVDAMLREPPLPLLPLPNLPMHATSTAAAATAAAQVCHSVGGAELQQGQAVTKPTAFMLTPLDSPRGAPVSAAAGSSPPFPPHSGTPLSPRSSPLAPLTCDPLPSNAPSPFKLKCTSVGGFPGCATLHPAPPCLDAPTIAPPLSPDTPVSMGRGLQPGARRWSSQPGSRQAGEEPRRCSLIKAGAHTSRLSGLLPLMQPLHDPSEITYTRLIGQGSYGNVYLGEWLTPSLQTCAWVSAGKGAWLGT